MNSTHVSSKTNELKGKVKENIGHAVGNKSLATEGVGDQIKAKVQDFIADAKDSVKKAIDNLLSNDKSRNTH